MPVWWVMMNVDTDTPRYIVYRKNTQNRVDFNITPTGSYEAIVYECHENRKISVRAIRSRGFPGGYQFLANYYTRYPPLMEWCPYLTREIEPLIINTRVINNSSTP